MKQQTDTNHSTRTRRFGATIVLVAIVAPTPPAMAALTVDITAEGTES